MAINLNDEQAKRLQEMQQQLNRIGQRSSFGLFDSYTAQAPIEHVTKSLGAVREEQQALRRDLQSLQGDIQGMLEADARRHRADEVANEQRREMARCLSEMFESFEVAMRDFVTAACAVQSTATVTQHPALTSLYNQLSLINSNLRSLRYIFHLQR